MACGGGSESLMNQLNSLVNQIDNKCAPCCMPSCCPPVCGDSYCIASCVDRPYVQCTMLCPPPCVIPTEPQPVKPLQLPCPQPNESETGENNGVAVHENIHSRHANFYNNYNVDYHNTGHPHSSDYDENCTPEKQRGTTVDGASPCCEDYTAKRKAIKESRQPKSTDTPGCPTGFKPCAMKLVAPPNCDPAGIWMAQVQPCPPKPTKRKVSNMYKPGQCKRPGCKHWEPKEGKCLYDEPCKAHCFNHPEGIKPRKKH